MEKVLLSWSGGKDIAVFAGPIFKEKIAYTLGETVQRNSFYFRDLLPKEEVE